MVNSLSGPISQVEWASGDLQGGANSISQVDGVLEMASSCWLCDGRAQQRENGLCPTFCLGESDPPALTLMLDTSVLPCMSPVPFKLLPQCRSSEGVSLSMSVWGFFKRNCLGLQKFLPLTQSPLVFAARVVGLIFLTMEPWTGWPGVGLGLLAPEISL